MRDKLTGAFVASLIRKLKYRGCRCQKGFSTERWEHLIWFDTHATYKVMGFGVGSDGQVTYYKNYQTRVGKPFGHLADPEIEKKLLDFMLHRNLKREG